MSLWRSTKGWAAGLVIAWLLLACGGGGVGEGGTGAFASGPISGFGSVMVGGVKFDDRSAAVDAEDDGDNPTLAQLQQGMVVSIEADDLRTQDDGSRTAVARRIRVAGSTIGPVTDVNLAGRSLRVMGLRVRLNAATVFDADLREHLRQGLPLAGQVVELWGYVDPQLPGYVATFVQLRTRPPAVYRARGLVRQVGGDTVGIGDQDFDFSGVATRPRVGQLVRVVVDPASVAAPWRVRRWNEVAGTNASRDGDPSELEGVLTSLTDARTFSVAGVPVVADAEVPGLTLGAYVKVAGTWRSGALRAESVKIETESDLDAREIKWEGTPSMHDAVNRRFELTTDAGRAVTVVYDGTTNFNGLAAAGLSSGVRVEVRGLWNAGELRAERIRAR